MVERVTVLSDYAALTNVTALFGSLGMLMLLFGLYTIRRALGLRERFTSSLYRNIALLACLVAVAGRVVLVIGDHVHHISGSLYTTAKLTNIPLNLWAAALGIALYKGASSLSTD